MSHFKTDRLRKGCSAILACTAILLAPAHSAPVHRQDAAVTTTQGVDLDLSINYYTRALTPEGVVRESRYQETMLRRPGHVWIARVLPAAASSENAAHGRDAAGAGEAGSPVEPAHRHFNHVLLPRHVTRTRGQLRLEFVDVPGREVIAIAPSDYDNVGFDGSWANAFFLADPTIVASLPLMNKTSPVAGAHWHEAIRDGVFHRVLWDEKRMVPLLLEKGDTKGSFLQRMEVKVRPGLARVLPWTTIKGYAQREYADFLD
jgi:hypothetical protein